MGLKRPFGSENLPTSAQQLINDIIMHPSIMWTRQFFFGLNSLPEEDQHLINLWFLEMNSKQNIYITEIEKANDQLKKKAM